MDSSFGFSILLNRWAILSDPSTLAHQVYANVDAGFVTLSLTHPLLTASPIN